MPVPLMEPSSSTLFQRSQMVREGARRLLTLKA